MPNFNQSNFILFVFGGLAGFAYFGVEEWVAQARGFNSLILTIAVFGGCFFSAALMMAGPVHLRRALIPAAGFGALVTAFVLWASFRFETAQDFVSTIHPFAMVFVMLLIAIPFMIAAVKADSSHRSYPDLFDALWGAVTRGIVALTFSGVFWLLLFLSDTLLNLVGLRIIERMLEVDPVPYILGGAIFGLALSVCHELSDLLSPQLLLRLLRLLMPLVTVVVAIFVIALPFRGISELFGSISAGATLMGMGIVAIGLVSASIDRTPDEGVQWPWMKALVQVLACFVPILGALAIYAVWLRVADYGWTPDRLAAVTIAGTVFVYGLVYAGSVLLRGDWGQRLRQGNIWLAGGVLAVLFLWLTPVMNPQNISARSQLARFAANSDVQDLPLYELRHSWGHAGRAAFGTIKAQYDETQDAVGIAAIERAENATNWYTYNSRRRKETFQLADLANLDDKTVVYPEGAVVPSELFSETYYFEHILKPCTETPCVLIAVPAGDATPEHFVLFSLLDQNLTRMWMFDSDGPEIGESTYEWLTLTPAQKQAIMSGQYTIAPPRWSSVQIEGADLHSPPWHR